MMELKVGLQFASYEELTDFIHLYEKETKQKLWKRSSRTLKSTKRLKKQFNERIQYYEIQYSCIHGGQRTPSKSKGLRRVSSHRVDCPFNIKLRASGDGQFLEIRGCNDQHENHSEYVKPQKSEKSKDESNSRKKLKSNTLKLEKISKQKNYEKVVESLEVMNADVLCRLCGNRSEHLISIYEGEGLDYQLQMKINRHLPFTVERTDTNLPSRCCYQCASTLLNWHDLIEASIKADKRLKIQFGAVTVKHLEETIQENSSDEKESDYFGESKKNENQNATTNINQKERSQAIAFVSFASFHNAQKSILSNQSTEPSSTQPVACIKTEDHSDSDDDRGDITASPLPLSEEERVVPKKVYSCDTCQETFITLKNFKTHLAETLHKTQSLPKGRPTNEPRYYCEVCDYGFPERELMIEHRDKAHQTSKTVKNEEETKSLGVEIKTEESEATVPSTPSSEDKELCNICNSLFAIKHDLKRHIRIRHPEISPTFSCDVCSKEFPRKNQMQKHRKELHADVPEKETLKRGRTQQNTDLLARCKVDYEGKPHYQCEHCPRIIHKPYQFLRHMTVHTGVRAFFCHLCGKNFRLPSGLTRHIKELHYGVKKYPCHICGRCFASKNTRDDHVNIHTGARPFVCDLCGKCYKQKASLNIHKTFHTNDKPHVCTTCGRQFRRAHELKVHGWVHTGYKPYACTTCDVSFRLSRGLKRHLDKRHGGSKDTQTTNGIKSGSHVKKDKKGDIESPPKKEASSSNVVVIDEGSGTSDTNQMTNEYFNFTRNYCGP